MLCNRLKILLNELNISQRQFALKLNLDPGYFSRIVQGKTTPPDRILLLIESVFNVNRTWLESGEGDIFITQESSLVKKQVLEAINAMSEEQVQAVAAFVKYLLGSNE